MIARPSLRRAILILTAAALLASACVPHPRTPRSAPPPGPPPWTVANPSCAGTASLVAYCCSCSPVDEQIAQRMKALNFSSQVTREVKECVSSQVHEWRSAAAHADAGGGSGAESIASRCTSQTETRDPKVTEALVEIIKDIFHTSPDATWEQCYAETTARGTCARRDRDLEQARAEHDQRVADEGIEEQRSQERQKSLFENLGKIISAARQPAANQQQEEPSAPWGSGGGVVRVAFAQRGTRYVARIEVRGAHGVAAVTFAGRTMREELALSVQPDGVFMVGANDSFQMMRDQSGRWQVVRVCDVNGLCTDAESLGD
jgi:hypothetical protein